jgi:hypothetical protein
VTPSQRSAISVGVRTTLIGAAVIALASAAKQYVIYRPEYQLHIAVEQEMLKSLLILQCRSTPDDTICRDYR